MLVFVALPRTCVFIVIVSILAQIILDMDNRRIITRLRRKRTESDEDAAGATSSHEMMKLVSLLGSQPLSCANVAV